MKIGIYTDDEILEFMAEGEGRGFLGRSMFDAMYFKIKEQDLKIEEMRKELINQDEYIAKLKEEYANQLQQKENIIKEAREKLNTQLAFTSSYQLNYQSAMSIIEEAKQILDKEVN